MPRTFCATAGRLRPDPYEELAPMSAPTQIRFYQTGSFAVGNRLLDPEQRSLQSEQQRTNSITCGHRACQGCGEALGARYALDAAMRATQGKLIAANATGCLEVFSTPYPRPPGGSPGSTRCSATRRPSRPASPRHCARRAARTYASSARAATAAPSTSASPACRGCSNATTTCCTSATTTRPT